MREESKLTEELGEEVPSLLRQLIPACDVLDAEGAVIVVAEILLDKFGARIRFPREDLASEKRHPYTVCDVADADCLRLLARNGGM